MTNPHLFRPGYTKQYEPRFAGGKYYRPRLEMGGRHFHARRIFKRASEAQAYAVAAILRWQRLYDEHMASLAVPATEAM